MAGDGAIVGKPAADQPGAGDAYRAEQNTEEERQPESVDTETKRTTKVAGAEVTRDSGGCPVSEEDVEVNGRREDRRGDASPASCGVPRLPTIAESARRKRGSATRAPKAGTARRRISRSWGWRGGSAGSRKALNPGATGGCCRASCWAGAQPCSSASRGDG